MPLSLLVTGFLGSGKTTFVLKSLVERYGYGRIGILVNDFGEVGYDKLRFYSENIEALGVDGLCLCCEGTGELLKALETLKGVDLLVLETSGLSDPYPLMKVVEEAGYGTPVVVCMLPADSWKDFHHEPVFRAQLEYADCVVISRCDLFEKHEEPTELLGDRPAFLCYEGRVEEDFFTFFEGKSPESKSYAKKKRGHAVRERFSQITLKAEGFYAMEELERFLRSLPPQVLRAKGFVRVLESPLPLGLNWTRNHLSWEAVQKPVENFITFIGYKNFILPPLPEAKKPDWKRMIPLGEFDKREGLAYLMGRAVDELSGVEWLIEQDLKDFLLITTDESFACPFKTQKTLLVKPSFESFYRLSQTLKRENLGKVLLWDIPDAFASYLIKELKGCKIFHVGRHFLLPEAELSLRVDTEEKAKAIKKSLQGAPQGGAL